MGAERIDLLHEHGKQRVHRWRRRDSAQHHDEVTVGWLPDGRWWVDDTRERYNGWVFAGPPVEARGAATAWARERMDGDGWTEVVAQYRQGTQEPDDVPPWPPGHEPG